MPSQSRPLPHLRLRPSNVSTWNVRALSEERDDQSKGAKKLGEARKQHQTNTGLGQLGNGEQGVQLGAS